MEQAKSAKFKADSVGSSVGTIDSSIENSKVESSRIENRNSKTETPENPKTPIVQPQIANAEVQTSPPQLPEQCDIGIQTSQSLLDPVVDVYQQEATNNIYLYIIYYPKLLFYIPWYKTV